LKAFYTLGKYHSGDYEFFFEIEMKKEQFRAKNRLTVTALNLNCEFMWQIDDDTVLSPNTFEVLMKMLDDEPDAGVAGCLYQHKGGDEHPVVMWVKMTPIGTSVADYYQPHELTGEVMEVGVTGGGCMLFRMAAFKDMMEPYFWNEADLGTDVQICLRMLEKGWKVLCHTGHEVGHVGERKVWYPSVIDPEMAAMHRFNEKLYYDMLDFLGVQSDEYYTLVIKSMAGLQEKWLEMKPETASEMKGVYEDDSIQDLSVARNVYYNSKRRKDWGQFTTYVREVKPKRGLDFGCGVGIGAQIMAQHGVSVLAIDLDIRPMDFLEWRAERHGFAENLEVVRMEGADGREYLPDEVFDVIVVKDVLEHLTNPEEVLRELLVRLNLGGLMVCNAHIAEFKGAEDGHPQHLDLLGAERFGEVCYEYGVKPWFGCLLRKEA